MKNLKAIICIMIISTRLYSQHDTSGFTISTSSDLNNDYSGYILEALKECVQGSTVNILSYLTNPRTEYGECCLGKDYGWLIEIKAVNVVMERILATHYNYYTKSTDYSQGYNLMADVEILVGHRNSTALLLEKRIIYQYAGPWQTGFIPVSIDKAIEKTTYMMMAELYSWLNTDYQNLIISYSTGSGQTNELLTSLKQ